MRSWIAALVILLPALGAAPDALPGTAFGNPKAPITIEVYSDFQCPHCKRFHDEELPLIVKDYVKPGKAYLIYRSFPLPQHPYARRAAELACACAELNKYEQAASALWANQNAWSVNGDLSGTLAKVLTPAEQKKVESLSKEMAVQSSVNHDLALGQALPLGSTPTVVVTFKAHQYKLDGEGLFNYNWVKTTLDELK